MFLIYENGNIISIGCKNVPQMEQCVKRLKEHFLNIHVLRGNPLFIPKVQNLVAPMNLNQKVPLSILAIKYPSRCHYEPERFPGATITLSEPGVSSVWFNKGKVNIVGPKNMKQVHKAFLEVLEIFRSI